MFDVTGDIDATDQGIVAQDLALAGRGQRIFVIDVRIGGADDDVAFGQIVYGYGFELRANRTVIIMDTVCLERLHGSLSRDGGLLQVQSTAVR